VYSNGGGTSIGGLTSGSTYFVIKRDNSIIRLASTAANAAASPAVAVNLTSTPVSGTHTLTVTALNFTTDTFTIPSHGFLTR
jgi:hypothetical protein